MHGGVASQLRVPHELGGVEAAALDALHVQHVHVVAVRALVLVLASVAARRQAGGYQPIRPAGRHADKLKETYWTYWMVTT